MNATPNGAAVPDDPDDQTLAVPLPDKRKRRQSFPLLLPHAKQEQGSKVRMTTSRSHGPRLLLFVQSSSRDGPPGSALVHAKAVDSQEGGLNSATTAAPGSGFVLFAGLFEEPGFGHEGRAHRRRRGDRHDRHRV